MPPVSPDRDNGSMHPVHCNVFIVDDSAPVRSRLADLLAGSASLRLAGEAATAGEAIAGILRTLPDAVLLDLNLMGHTGLEVLRAVRRAHPEVVFVVLTNRSAPQYRRASAEAGAAYFLDKSTDIERVVDVLSGIAPTRH